MWMRSCAICKALLPKVPIVRVGVLSVRMDLGGLLKLLDAAQLECPVVP